MDIKILEFLRKHRISVLSVLNPHGNPHSVSLHYALLEDPMSFLFITEKSSRKCEALLDEKSHPASLVIGFSEEEFVTFQAEGEIKIVTAQEELENVWSAYLTKFPPSQKRKNDSDFVVLQFIPSWWSYSDYKTAPLTKISSEK